MPDVAAGRLSVLVLAAVVLAGCAASRPTSSGVRPLQWADHQGTWLSSGYGHAVEIDGDQARLHHVADGICVANPEGEISILDFYDLHEMKGPDTLALSSVLDPFVYTFHRADALPAACLSPTPDTPLDNFEAFVAFYAEHYAFFDLYGVDWAERSARARTQVTADTGDQALFEVMSELLRPLKDSHIKLEAQVEGERRVYDGKPGKTDVAVAAWGERAGIDAREAVGQFRRAYWLDGIRDTLLDGAGVLAANGRIQYGMVAPDVGYVAVATMGGFVNGELDTTYQELAALDAVMEDAMAMFEDQRARAVILDLSLNTGGHDFIGLAIAGRFAATRVVGYTRRAGDDPIGVDFPIHVEPSQGRRFIGPAYVLTSDLTKSAGEVGPLAMRALDNVTHVGEHTRGAFSTILVKYLPSGWVLSLSNEIYTDPAGRVWEGEGIEPEIAVPVFDETDPNQGHVEAVRAVMALIDERH